MKQETITIHEALRWASSFLENASRETKVAEILLRHELNLNQAQLISRLRDTMNSYTYHSYKEKIEQHAATGIPVQHLTGEEEFFGRTFQVNQDVLIPRPETEELVDRVIRLVREKGWKSATFVDVGTGSGIIAITLALELEEFDMMATDISADALKVAQNNAQNHQASIRFLEGDFLMPLIKEGIKVDMIISNPPYISYAETEELSDTVKNFDPNMALFADQNGLAAYQAIMEQAPQVLKPGGIIAFEIGHTQSEDIQTIIHKAYPNSQVKTYQDINQKNRIIITQT
ncbi:peptide chain release factor N(5)-glutamine methyltransferase [Gracilibacillus sp. YIM 98692]|uniref:peptide chain release factor N(5)-glutamine methyltransferase n=1 Tax=Gracilibacillus sp. YIM 98692 TaxID=2663532 RepID=UPI0013D49D72|nr:peptide chain release factor N(5)-glutamine methyltransferase [Gracilibacillus sp. YIM 98692]